MNDDLESFLRAELAGRAESAPVAFDDGLADTAIGGAKRIRRRRRIGAAAGGLSLVVLGTVSVVWMPWQTNGITDGPPAATSVEEAQTELDIEFVVERGGGWGIVTTDDDYVPLEVEDEPLEVKRLADSYMVAEDTAVELVSFNGTERLTYESPTRYEEYFIQVRGDGEAFALTYNDIDYTRQYIDIYPDEIAQEPEGPTSIELSYEPMLVDWTDEVMVLSASLLSDTAGEAGTFYFNDQYDWNIEAIGAAGYEAAVFIDGEVPGFACVSDLRPGELSASESEECGYLEDEPIQQLLTDAAAGESEAVERVADITDRHNSEVDLFSNTDDETAELMYESEHIFSDPNGEWQLAFSSRDDTWTLLDLTGEEPVVSELTPPDGALFPVVSHS